MFSIRLNPMGSCQLVGWFALSLWGFGSGIWARGIQGNVCGQSRKGDQNLNGRGTEQKWNGSDTVEYSNSRFRFRSHVWLGRETGNGESTKVLFTLHTYSEQTNAERERMRERETTRQRDNDLLREEVVLNVDCRGERVDLAVDRRLDGALLGGELATDRLDVALVRVGREVALELGAQSRLLLRDELRTNVRPRGRVRRGDRQLGVGEIAHLCEK
jgi:hypothetical protein